MTSTSSVTATIHLPAIPLTDAEFAEGLKARGVTVEGAAKNRR